jgi:predicted small metal-binding protein
MSKDTGTGSRGALPILESTTVSVHDLESGERLLGVDMSFSCGCHVSCFCFPDELQEVLDTMIDHVEAHHGKEVKHSAD